MTATDIAVTSDNTGELFRLGPLTGLDTTTASYEFEFGSGLFPDGENIVPAENYGGFSTTLGRKNRFSNTLPAPATGGFVWHRPNGLPDVYLFYVTDSSGLGQLYYATLGGAFTKIVSYPDPSVTGYPPNTQAYFAAMQNWCFVTVGSGIPIKLDQTLNVTYWGISAPVTWPTVSPAQGGNLLGSYYYCATFASATQESSQGAINPFASILTGIAATYGTANVSISGTITANDVITLYVNNVAVASYKVITGDSAFNIMANLASQINFNAAVPVSMAPGVSGATGVATFAAKTPGASGNTITFFFGKSSGATEVVSPAGATPLAGGQGGGQTVLTNIPQPTDAQVTTINLYRIGGSIGQWRLIASLPVGTLAFTDNIPDTNITGQALIVYRDTPPQFISIAAHQGRIIGFGTASDASAVWFSNYNEPWAFNSSTGVLHADYAGYGDAAVACGSIGNVLVLCKQRTTYIMWGSTDADFEVFYIQDVGCAAARSLICTKGFARWLTRSLGVVVCDGSTIQSISDGTLHKSNIKSVLDALTANTRVGCAAFFCDKAYHLSIPSLGKTFRFDERFTSWWRLGWAFGVAISDPESDVQVVASDLASGEVDQWFGDKYDRGSIVSAYVTSPRYVGELDATKQIDFVRIEGPQQPPGTQCTYTLVANPGAVNSNSLDNRPAAMQSFTSPVALDGSIGGGLNIRQDRVPDAMIGYDFQITLAIATTEQTYIGKVAVFGNVKRRQVSEG